jgi:hypothetical protein
MGTVARSLGGIMPYSSMNTIQSAQALMLVHESVDNVTNYSAVHVHKN